MYVYGVADEDVAAYLALLVDEGWKVTQSSDTLFIAQLTIEDAGVAYIEIEYQGYVVITIYAMLDDLPLAEWPADDIADLLGDDVEDILPEYDGDNLGFYLLNDSYGYAVQVLLDEDVEEADALEYYITVVLDDAGYTEYGPDAYGDMKMVKSLFAHTLVPLVPSLSHSRNSIYSQLKALTLLS